MSEALHRLGDERVSVRRIAALDLSREEPGDGVLAGIVGHLERGESDEKTALCLIGVLERADHGPARTVLRRLYDDERTPVRVAHAAILAHDRIEETHGA